ncbi:MAG: AMP-binding protein, partial [Anaerolineales bacterium]
MLPAQGPLPRILAQQLTTSPGRVAIVLATRNGEEALTVRHLLRGAAAFADRYRRAGVVAGEVVVDLLPPGADLLYAFLGAMLLGAIPSILPFQTEKLDPDRYRESLVSLMEVTHPAALVAERHLAEALREQHLPRAGLKAILDAGPTTDTQTSPLEPSSWEGCAGSEDDIALLQHSSGTTGLQKGVALSHRAILNQLRSYAPAVSLAERDVVVSWLPLYHDMGLIAGFLMPLLTGVKLVLLSPFEWVRAPWRLLEAVSRHRGTLSWLPNFAYNFCAQRIPES